MPTKICTKCELEQPLDEYWMDSSAPDGRRSLCKECSSQRNKERNLNKERPPETLTRRAPSRKWIDPRTCYCYGMADRVDFCHVEGRSAVNAALAICKPADARPCPASAECLQYALETVSLGVWGGTTELQRKKMRRDANRKKKG